MESYKYYYIELADGRFVFKKGAAVGSVMDARRFAKRSQAISYAKKYFGDSEFTVKGGGTKEILPYEY